MSLGAIIQKRKKNKKEGEKNHTHTPQHTPLNLLLFVFHKTNYRLEIAVINLISHLGANPAVAGKCNSGRE